MRLTVVGCSGSLPGPASPASCYLLEADHQGRVWRLVLDLGSGSLGPLQLHANPSELDAVAISHLHMDHCADLAALHVYGSHHEPPAAPIQVMGPFGTATMLSHLRGKDTPSPVLDVHVWQTDRTWTVGPFEVTVVAVAHPVPTYAMRIEGPSTARAGERAVLVYSGDTAWCSELVTLARGADVLLCEASFVDGTRVPEGLHMTGTEAGQVAHEAQVGQLIVTHVPPWNDPQRALEEASRAFDGATSLAVPGQHIVI